MTHRPERRATETSGLTPLFFAPWLLFPLRAFATLFVSLFFFEPREIQVWESKLRCQHVFPLKCAIKC